MLRGWGRRLVAGVGALWLSAACPATAEEPISAVGFVYHRFGESAFPSTNTTIAQLEAHIAALQSDGYTVRSLPEIIAALRRREPLPDRTVALTVDDAFASIYHEAWPRWRQAGMPFTVFVATDPVDSGHPNYMSWDQLRALAAAGVTIGHHTASHAHLPELTAEELTAELARATRRFREELGMEPALFAYPYGEYGLREQRLVREAGFAAAFGQHSGVMHAEDDLFGLPRFALNERFGSRDRFELAAGALPLPVSDLTPLDRVLHDSNPPAVGFTVAPEIGGLESLRCYASNLPAPARIERLGHRRIEVRIGEPFPSGRGRLNCTVPAAEGRWRWLGLQFTIPPGR